MLSDDDARDLATYSALGWDASDREVLAPLVDAAFVGAEEAEFERVWRPDRRAALAGRPAGVLTARRATGTEPGARGSPRRRTHRAACLSVYDACYVVLAEARDAVLVTADRRLAEATPNGVLITA